MWSRFTRSHIDTQGQTIFIQAARTPGRVRRDFLLVIFLVCKMLCSIFYPECRAARCTAEQNCVICWQVEMWARLFIHFYSQGRNNSRRTVQTFLRNETVGVGVFIKGIKGTACYTKNNLNGAKDTVSWEEKLL